MIYRVHKDTGDNGSDGYEYFSNKADGIRFLKTFHKNDHFGGETTNEFFNKNWKEFDVPKGKTGWLRFLNAYCSHPNNG